MPLKSQAQRKWMWANHPEMARRWEKETPKGRLPAKKGKPVKHPGFRGASKQIATRQGISQERARAILAAGARKASAGAKRRNPRLKRVRGIPPGGK